MPGRSGSMPGEGIEFRSARGHGDVAGVVPGAAGGRPQRHGRGAGAAAPDGAAERGPGTDAGGGSAGGGRARGPRPGGGRRRRTAGFAVVAGGPSASLRGRMAGGTAATAGGGGREGVARMNTPMQESFSKN